MNLAVLNALRERTDGVIVAVSRGKDSLACLDLARRHFARVEAYCMTLVPGLSFVEDYLCYLERRYGMSIDRVPHWHLSRMFRHGVFRPLCVDVPRLTVRDVQDEQRQRTGIDWIISGEKRRDSLQRRGMISSRGVLDEKVRVAYPLADWTDAQVYNHLKRRLIPLPPDYRYFDRSFSCDLTPESAALLREHFPEDFARVSQVFPFVTASALRGTLARRPAPASLAGGQPRRGRAAKPDQPSSLQSQDDRPTLKEETARESGS